MLAAASAFNLAHIVPQPVYGSVQSIAKEISPGRESLFYLFCDNIFELFPCSSSRHGSHPACARGEYDIYPSQAVERRRMKGGESIGEWVHVVDHIESNINQVDSGDDRRGDGG